eukprot:CAMPEP_0117442702 /NCGR_PEP_ID=MMETSP0759-20121206/4294_1 /TAXON_ID=63605 /ORGANISM="Percolomonas cosmopolitus, Strain WS" /LENGTH=167 /DNA_ID=CAMNT_0005234611 /DNA_START=377 /DNA_END=880 /DNA_ORIENTATION=+
MGGNKQRAADAAASSDPSHKQALYLFYYLHEQNMLFSFMPQVESLAYTCKMLRTPHFKKFPSVGNTGILELLTYVGQVDTPTKKNLDYWALDVGGLFSFDLMLDHESQTPVKLSVSSDDIIFERFNATRPDESVWKFPNHTVCALMEDIEQMDGGGRIFSEGFLKIV